MIHAAEFTRTSDLHARRSRASAGVVDRISDHPVRIDQRSAPPEGRRRHGCRRRAFEVERQRRWRGGRIGAVVVAARPAARAFDDLCLALHRELRRSVVEDPGGDVHALWPGHVRQRNDLKALAVVGEMRLFLVGAQRTPLEPWWQAVIEGAGRLVHYVFEPDHMPELMEDGRFEIQFAARRRVQARAAEFGHRRAARLVDPPLVDRDVRVFDDVRRGVAPHAGDHDGVGVLRRSVLNRYVLVVERWRLFLEPGLKRRGAEFEVEVRVDRIPGVGGDDGRVDAIGRNGVVKADGDRARAVLAIYDGRRGAGDPCGGDDRRRQCDSQEVRFHDGLPCGSRPWTCSTQPRST